MFLNSPLYNTSEASEENFEGELYCFNDEFRDDSHVKSYEGSNNEEKNRIAVGDFLPCGPRMYYKGIDNIVRIKDIAMKKRILLIGAIGSFTPDCWNRHLYLVLDKLSYFEEREVDYICCITTNDPYTQRAWGLYLGCQDTVLMWADVTKRFTKAIGMDIVVPWLDNNIRSRRYIILADDLQVTKILVAPNDDLEFNWQCEHFADSEKMEDTEDEIQLW